MNTFNLPTDKIPEHLQEVVKSIQNILGDKAYDFLLIGATARDLIMEGQYDIGIDRKTLDIDFAIYIPEWEAYDGIMSMLVASGDFTATKLKHRVLYKGDIEVDIVPFGDIQDENGEYDWPPDFMNSMNVAGFVEINENGVIFQSDNNALTVKVAPIHGICIMKIFAWEDRKYKDNKDGRDLGFIIANYVELKQDIMYESHQDIIEADDFDIILSGARVLGRDMHDIISGNKIALDKIKQIVEKELEDEDNSLLARTMAIGQAFRYEKSYNALVELLKGLNDRKK